MMSEPKHPAGGGMDDFDMNQFLRQVDFDSDSGPDTGGGDAGDGGGDASPADTAGPSPSGKNNHTCQSGDGAAAFDSAEDSIEADLFTGGERTHPQRKHTRPPQKQSRRSRRKRRIRRLPLGIRVLRRLIIILVWLAVIAIVGYFLGTAGWNWANDLLALDKEEWTTTVTLEDYLFTEETVFDEETGETSVVLTADMDEVADLLHENGLIEYDWLFKLFTRFTNKTRSLVPGTYELSTEMDYSALLRSMGPSSVARATVTVTVPEGYTLDQILDLLADSGVAAEEDLWDAAANYDFDYDFLDRGNLGDANRLEGYLFPDTYEFYQDTEASSALNRMLSNFNTKIYDELDQTALDAALDRGYSLRDLVIIASIVEKETDGLDQAGIASVIYNRLSTNDGGTNGFLQMDSTIQYILEERKETLSAEDLLIDSPYNTYLYPGLPVGPICCPGLDALKAAVSPDQTDYFYFILGDDGSTHFFEDYDSFVVFRDAQTGVIQSNEVEYAEYTEEDEAYAGAAYVEDDAQP